MKKRKILMILLLAIASCIFINVNKVEAYYVEKEDNNYEYQATSIAVNEDVYGSAYDQYYHSSMGWDYDNYKFTLSSPGYVNIIFDHDFQLGYWQIVLKDSQLNSIATVNAEENITRTKGYDLGLPAGTYYLEVSGYQVYDNVDANYRFKITYNRATNWETENNGSSTTANNLTLGQVKNGCTVATSVSPYSLMGAYYVDNDYYKFTLPRRTTIDVNFNHDYTGSSYFYYDIIIYDINSNEVSAMYDFHNLTNKRAVTLNAGTYFLKIVGTSHELGCKYRLKVSIATPRNVKAKSNSYNSNKITWNGVAGISRYEIYRATSQKGSYTKIGNLSSTTYVDKKLITGKKYFYKVRAIGNGTGTSDFSPVVNSKPSLKKATIAVSRKSKKATIKWNKVSGANGYEVFMATSKKGKYKKIKTIKKGSIKKFTKKKLKKNKKYYFKVRAYKNVNGKKVYGSYSKIRS